MPSLRLQRIREFDRSGETVLNDDDNEIMNDDGFQCNELTGQCRCVPGVKGRDCSQCAPRHVLTPAKSCKDCNGVCTGTLGR